MHTDMMQHQTETPEERFGKAFAEACMKTSVEEALRRGWTRERLHAAAGRFTEVIREEAVEQLKWVLEQGRTVVDLMDSGRMGPGWLDVTFNAAVLAVAARTLKRMEA